MTRRRWIADTWDEATASLTGEQAAHLIRVLRAEPGMEFDIVAGDRVCHAVIAAIGADSVRFNLLAEIASDPALPITLLLSVFKFDRMEWAIEKATELGVSRIIPIVARRSEKHLAQAAQNRTSAGAESPTNPQSSPAAPTFPSSKTPSRSKPPQPVKATRSDSVWPSRSARQLCATRSNPLSNLQRMNFPISAWRLAPKADGLPKKKPFLTMKVGSR